MRNGEEFAKPTPLKFYIKDTHLEIAFAENSIYNLIESLDMGHTKRALLLLMLCYLFIHEVIVNKYMRTFFASRCFRLSV